MFPANSATIGEGGVSKKATALALPAGQRKITWASGTRN